MSTGYRLLAGMALLGISAAGAATLDPGESLSSLGSVPLKMVQAPLAKRIELAASKSRPYQFAVNAPLPASLDDGLWDQVDGDTSRWRLRISSPGAETLNFEFARFHLPADAALWIYDADGQLVQGPYTAANETAEGRLWSAMVPGSVAVLDLRVPSTARDAVDLELAAANHGFRGFGKASGIAKSGSCNIDTVCTQGDDWRDEIRAVARVSVGGQLFCTGQLVNNTKQDLDPLFVTANHCEIGQTVSTPASSVVVYWNYATSTCGGIPNGSLDQSQTGSTLLAGDVDTDFTLLRLNQTPNQAFNVYYAGWDAGTSIPQSGIAVHHPQGDEKRISVYNTAAARIENVTIDTGRDVDAWRIFWSQGTTEQGSSGGALWNQNHRMVGWLSGGFASCANQDGEDYFGRLELAWNSKPEASKQLKPWLDPLCSNTLSLCGRDSQGAAECATPADSCSSNGGGGGGGGSPSPAWLLLMAAAGLLRLSARKPRIA